MARTDSGLDWPRGSVLSRRLRASVVVTRVRFGTSKLLEKKRRLPRQKKRSRRSLLRLSRKRRSPSRSRSFTSVSCVSKNSVVWSMANLLVGKMTQ